jgi:hypothetical protein
MAPDYKGNSFRKNINFLKALDNMQKKNLSFHTSYKYFFMANTPQLLAKLKTLQYSGSTKPYSDAVSLIETTYRTQAYALLERSVSESAAVGILIELKGLGTRGGGYSYVEWANIFMPANPAPRVPASDTYLPMDIMTYFLFETRNATRAIKYCELRRNAARNVYDSQILNSFVYFCGEYETRSGLELGEMWDALIKEGKTASGSLTPHARYLYNLYKTYPTWRSSSSVLGKAIDSTLNSSYRGGGGTRREAYALDYDDCITLDPYKQSLLNATCAGSTLSTP